MLEELIRITSMEPYKSNGGMRVREISIRPWETPNAKFVFEVWTDEWKDDEHEMWEVTCADLAQTQGIPIGLIPRTQIKLYDDHPVLWDSDDEVYFTALSGTKDIPALMGELFIEHSKLCGNWLDFHRYYDGLPQTLETLRENQLAIPIRLKEMCFQVLERHGVQFRINTVEQHDNKYQALFFSNEAIWPDNENFSQSYIMANEFSARRLG